MASIWNLALSWTWAGFSLHIVANLVVAVLCGSLLGMERSARGRQAGMRTYALVCLAAACVLSGVMIEPSSSSGDVAARVVQGLMTGLGFLGAGVIMQDGLNIKGLTTAASIWLTSGIGILSGLGLWGLAIFATFFGLVILSGMKWIEARIPKDHYAQVTIKLPADSKIGEGDVKELLRSAGLVTVGVAFKRDAKKRVEFEMSAVYGIVEGPNKLAEKLISMDSLIEAFEISSSPE